MKLKVNLNKIIDYIKVTLIILLVVIEVVACVQAAGTYIQKELTWRITVFVALGLCCLALTILECVSMFSVKRFSVKMVVFAFACVLLLAICILTGNSLLSALYCIVLTECYMTVDKFSHKIVLFGVGCATFVVSFVVGWVIMHPNAALFNSIVEIVSGALFGLMAIAIDFVVTQFLYSFYRTNTELRQALKEADESRAELKEAYEQLARTGVYEERNRIAKDIHDNAGHSMTAVIMQTEAAKLLIDSNPAEAKNRIISANIQAKNALEQMRESVHLLAGREDARPLKAELEEIIVQTFDGTEVKARYDVCDVQPSPEICRFLTNSAKEFLANGIRHGGATAFYIELKEENGLLKLLVSDNGVGCAGAAKEGFGLRGIREKAEKLGGSCRFSGDEDEGFEALICLPVIQPEAINERGNKND